MKKPENWDEVKAAGDFEKLAAGGYVIRITDVEDNAEKEYLTITYDIAEGEEKGRFGGEWGAEHPYAHRFIRSYKNAAVGMFKAFINAVEASNEGFEYKFKESALIGKILGVVIGYEEYNTTSGTIGQRTYIRTVKSADDIRAGKFVVPDLKRMKAETPEAAAPVPGFAELNSDDLPF